MKKEMSGAGMLRVGEKTMPTGVMIMLVMGILGLCSWGCILTIPDAHSVHVRLVDNFD